MENEKRKLGSWIAPWVHSIDSFMAVRVLDHTDEQIRFVLEDTPVAIANALRRVMISEVPTMAIDELQVESNTSIMQNEFLAHRMCLLPLLCKETVQKATFELDVTCEGAARDVLARDLVSLTDGVEICHPDALLAKLCQGQTLKFQATAQWGTGAQHAKWSPVCTATYRFIADIPPEDEDSEDEQDEVLRAIQLEDRAFCAEDIGQDPSAHHISMKYRADAYLFTVETKGSLAPHEIVQQAFRVLQGKLDHLHTSIHDLPALPRTPPGTPPMAAVDD